jgi:hypothetical protein
MCRITNAVKESGGLKEKLFHTAYNAKRQAILKGKNSMQFIEVRCPYFCFLYNSYENFFCIHNET